jgi:tetratricopeptide (TPR) repeat protein
MKITITVLLTALMTLVGSVAADDGLECALDVYQYDPISDAPVRLLSDTLQVIQGIPVSGFLVTFSVDIELTKIDTAQVGFLLHVITLGPPTNTYSRDFTVEYGLPARIDNIKGKGDSRYALVVTPLRAMEIDQSPCEYNHREKNLFAFNPSANADIYYLRNSIGDFYFPAAKGILEYGYREFQSFCSFNLPGKYDIFLCPCYIPSVIWDRRFAMSLDPTRSSGMVIFKLGTNSLDQFAINHIALLRNWGYAPPLLSEGLASHGSLPEFHARKLKAKGVLPSMATLVNSADYYTAEPFAVDRAAASLVSYLIGSNGIDRYRKLYRAADDLNLAVQMAEIYETPLAELETEWLNWIDTVTITTAQVAVQSELAEAVFNYDLMREYADFLLARSTGRMDSLASITLLKRACFYTGDYYAAIEHQAQLAQYDTTSAQVRMTLGTYRMMSGYYAEAHEDLLKAKAMAPKDPVIAFNVALSFLNDGDSTAAETILDSLVAVVPSGSSSAESRVILAEIMRHSPVKTKRERAQTLYEQAIALLRPAMQSQPASPALHLWSGMALVGMGRLAEAGGFLETALFLESRPFYIALDHLWQGKLADLEHDRELAVYHYQQVLSGMAADYHQRDARRYLEEPFTQ